VDLIGRNHQVWNKVQEELEELQVEVEAGDQDKIALRVWGCFIYDQLHAFLNVNPEGMLLNVPNKKFIKRFYNI
jgi:XTP/dITP diphosphohydrolase